MSTWKDEFMPSITAVALNALLQDQARVERIASNLANVSTPGYKRELWVQQTTQASAFNQSVDTHGSESSFAVGAEPTISRSSLSRDLRPGSLRATGRSLDLALTGPGYFEVATDHGPAYTRLGQFQVDARGRIVTGQGHALIGAGGEIVLASDRVTVDASGRLSEGGHAVGQLRIVDWAVGELNALGNGLFTARGTPTEVPAEQVAVRQGFVENANVNSAQEMVSLTAAVRHFEAMLRFSQGRDEMVGTAIRKLGDF